MEFVLNNDVFTGEFDSFLTIGLDGPAVSTHAIPMLLSAIVMWFV